ncbi:MAG: MFS transporter [Chitinophagaceae bacterium]|nr:MFS transporter [Chitinophagaceae bacterium]
MPANKVIIHPRWIVAIALLLITLSINISMPLFRIYSAAAGMNNAQTSLVLAAYILGMLPCYVFIGGISDRIGRKPILVVSVCCALLATCIITVFPDVYGLIAARVLQGVGLGLSMGTGTAFISELLTKESSSATKAANSASLFTSIGFGGGALATTIVLLNHFTLTPVTYFILIGITFAGLILVLFLPRLPPMGGSLIRLPYFPKGSFPINLAIAICWAANGVVIAIIPSELEKYGLTIYGGFCLVLMNWSGAFLQPFIRRMDPLRSVKLGFYVVPVGFGLVCAGSYASQLPVIFIGSFIMGLAAYGFSYMGGLSIIAELGGLQKARAVSGYMFYGYVGFGIPAIFLGYIADRIGILNSLYFFELVIIGLSVYLFYRIKNINLASEVLLEK